MADLQWHAERLDWDSLPGQPMDLFGRWHVAAAETEPWHGAAMQLACATKDGMPSARTVLMRGFGEDGIQFFTNYESRKGQIFDENPVFAAVFWWPSQVRQVRMEGRVARLSRAASDAYFAGRPRGSQLGAWSSPQSQTIGDLASLRQRYAAIEKAFSGKPVACPPFWGGYLLEPLRVEFWQGGQDRLHDRALYEKDGACWTLTRLAP